MMRNIELVREFVNDGKAQVETFCVQRDNSDNIDNIVNNFSLIMLKLFIRQNFNNLLVGHPATIT